MLYWPGVKALRLLFALSNVYVFFLGDFVFFLCENSVWAMHGEVCSSHDSPSPRNTKREWLGSGTPNSANSKCQNLFTAAQLPHSMQH